MTFQDRIYQTQAIERGMQSFERSEKNGVVVIPTGGGKSFVIGKTAAELPGKSLILQPSKEILEQNYMKTMKFGHNDLGVYSASLGMKKIRKITFATIGSIYKKPELFHDFDRILMDECDLTNPKGGMYKDFYSTVSLPIVGYTATPYRLHPATSMNGSVIKFITRTRPRIFHDLIHITQNKELFEKGYLCPLDYIKEEDDPRQLRFNSTGAEFTDDSIRAYNEALHTNDKILTFARSTVAKHILIFVPFITDAEAVLKLLEGAGISAAMVTGETPTPLRSRILAEFKAGKIKAVVNVGVLTVGFDFPELDCIICARPTNSVRLYYQIVGRGIRTAPGKDICQFIDLAGNVNRFGPIEDFEIVGENGMYRLKSGQKFLTGVDMSTGHDLEAARAAPAPMAQSLPSGDTKMKFGRYINQCVKTVPAHYLKWITENFGAGFALDQATDELNRRRSLGLKI